MHVATLRYKRHRGELPFIFKLGLRLVADQSSTNGSISNGKSTRRM